MPATHFGWSEGKTSLSWPASSQPVSMAPACRYARPASRLDSSRRRLSRSGAMCGAIRRTRCRRRPSRRCRVPGPACGHRTMRRERASCSPLNLPTFRRPLGSDLTHGVISPRRCTSADRGLPPRPCRRPALRWTRAPRQWTSHRVCPGGRRSNCRSLRLQR